MEAQKRPYRRRSKVTNARRRNVYLSEAADNLFWSIADAVSCSYSEAVDKVVQFYIRHQPRLTGSLHTDSPPAVIPVLLLNPTAQPSY